MTEPKRQPLPVPTRSKSPHAGTPAVLPPPSRSGAPPSGSGTRAIPATQEAPLTRISGNGDVETRILALEQMIMDRLIHGTDHQIEIIGAELRATALAQLRGAADEHAATLLEDRASGARRKIDEITAEALRLFEGGVDDVIQKRVDEAIKPGIRQNVQRFEEAGAAAIRKLKDVLSPVEARLNGSAATAESAVKAADGLRREIESATGELRQANTAALESLADLRSAMELLERYRPVLDEIRQAREAAEKLGNTAATAFEAAKRDRETAAAALTSATEAAKGIISDARDAAKAIGAEAATARAQALEDAKKIAKRTQGGGIGQLFSFIGVVVALAGLAYGAFYAFQYQAEKTGATEATPVASVSAMPPVEEPPGVDADGRLRTDAAKTDNGNAPASDRDNASRALAR